MQRLDRASRRVSAVAESNVDCARAQRQPRRREPELPANGVAHLVTSVVEVTGFDSLTEGGARLVSPAG